jgi:hypothetical protein
VKIAAPVANDKIVNHNFHSGCAIQDDMDNWELSLDAPITHSRIGAFRKGRASTIVIMPEPQLVGASVQGALTGYQLRQFGAPRQLFRSVHSVCGRCAGPKQQLGRE